MGPVRPRSFGVRRSQKGGSRTGHGNRILDSPGPVVVTSIRPDVLTPTLRRVPGTVGRVLRPRGDRRRAPAGARFSITARKDRAVTAAISAIPDDAWTAIRYPKAVFD